MNTAQHIIALDARYNNYRSPANPQFRTLYMRRRSHLLREKAKQEQDSAVRRQYLLLRRQLLAQRYGPLSVTESLRSVSLRSRTSSIEASFDSLHLHDSPTHEAVRKTHKRYNSSGSFQFYPTSSSYNRMMRTGLDFAPEGVIPTPMASASRAMAGNTTLAENYAFSGMFHVFDQHGDKVTAIKFAHNDKYKLACSSLDGTLSICNLSTQRPSVMLTLHGHSQGVTDMDWAFSDDFILSSSLDASARVWSPNSGELIRIIRDTYASPVYACRFLPMNNNLVVTGNHRGLVQVYNISTGKCTKGGSAKAVGGVRSLVFNSTGTLLWAGDDKGFIVSFVIDVISGKLQRGKRILVSDNAPVTSLSERSWISREARDPSLLVNCAADALFLFRITDGKGGLKLKARFAIKHQNEAIRSSFCPLMSFRQGACVVTGSEDSTVYFFNVEQTDKTLNKLMGHSSPVLDVCWNYDESLLASCDTEGTVIIWKREQRGQMGLKDE